MANPFNMPPRAWDIVLDVVEKHEHLGLTMGDIMSPCRAKLVSHARQECFARIRELRRVNGQRSFSMERIGEMFAPASKSGKAMDHSTVVYGIRQYNLRQEEERDVQEVSSRAA